MYEQQAATAAISLGLSGIGLLIVALLMRVHLIDSFRDQLFALRDELFLYACDEGLLNSPAHANLRLLMNGMIRYAHRTSLARLVVLNLARKLFRVPLGMPTAFREWVAAVNALPAAHAQRFREFHARAMLIAVIHMMSASPILWLVTVLFGAYFFVSRSTQMVISATANAVRRRMPEDLLESEAFKAARL